MDSPFTSCVAFFDRDSCELPIQATPDLDIAKPRLRPSGEEFGETLSSRWSRPRRKCPEWVRGAVRATPSSDPSSEYRLPTQSSSEVPHSNGLSGVFKLRS